MSKKSVLATLQEDEQSRAALEQIFTSSDDDDDDDNFFGASDEEDGPPAQEQVTKKRRTRFVRLSKTESNWWKLFLSPERKETMKLHPNGREDKKFRRLFRVPFFVFCERLMPLTISKWFPTWDSNQVDCWGQPVGDLELKLMGVLFVLGSGSTNFVVSLNTNLSEEVHRIFFLGWINQMSSIKDD